MKNVWDHHYQKDKSKLSYPDENLVRLLSKVSHTNKQALDFGTGSGRHIYLLLDKGYTVSASDSSSESIAQIKNQNLPVQLYHTESLPYPFSENQFGLIVSWGVFHYNQRETAKSMLKELHSSLDKGGYLLGSIRANTDTHLKIDSGEMNLQDLKGGYAETYELEDLKLFLSGFTNVEIGYSERTPLGKLEERICHWFFLAQKKG
ncbi:class I SAM-dependent methyltransferase [Leptospira idonii]|uniref:Class I SAM-dependent methyltransferase n=1 Tax=Leptospira idonii TaxID=1193500 RepID=A0A4R9M0U4_9LEPT|nr:class I SAM-dependent methyltransferase [Leptospira idonii]TGN19287.1 class I SAM-dependent methyltransferase [Leptospira idonii]